MIPNDILLLKIISFDGSLSLLKERGLSYSQIAGLLKKQKEEGYISFEDKTIALTNKGEKILQEYDTTHFVAKNGKMIRKEHLFFKPKSEMEVFLPRKRDIR